PKRSDQAGGEGWIRTSVRLRGQIYSLLPLTTRPPLQVFSRRAMWRRTVTVSTRGEAKSCRPSLPLGRYRPARLNASRALQNFDMPRACRALERVKGIEPSS